MRRILWAFILTFGLAATKGLKPTVPTMNRRRCLFQKFTAAALAVIASSVVPPVAYSLSTPPFVGTATTSPSKSMTNTATNPLVSQQSVAYKAMAITVEGSDSGVEVPVACWFPVDRSATTRDNDDSPKLRSSDVTYRHRISVRKIGQLLAGWDWIPDFASRDFELTPSLSSTVNGEGLPLPSRAPVVLLAHGYLGSRFDLSHLAEHLAASGFVCFAAEYPESLAASFDSRGIDRSGITTALLDRLKNDWKLQPTSFGIVGHSLGCGTALETGDDSWSRVLIAGFPRLRDGRPVPGKRVLLLTSMNDGAVSLSRWGGKEVIPSSNFQLIDPNKIDASPLPSRAAVVFEGDGAPNHISFLADNVNDAMIRLLSPLLPVAQALAIPVLDFDRYQLSRDSVSTAQTVHPVVSAYLKEHMLMQP